MSAPKLTPWFPFYVKPVREGVYRRSNGFYSFWNGRRWGLGCMGPMSAYYHRRIATFFPRLEWRGLAQEPKA
jgi:hypothetical protein